VSFWVDHSELEKHSLFFQLKNIITLGITGWSRYPALRGSEVRHLDVGSSHPPRRRREEGISCSLKIAARELGSYRRKTGSSLSTDRKVE